MKDLFDKIESLKQDSKITLSLSFLEVYNETIKDLLKKGKNLSIREDSQNSIIVPGLSCHQPTSVII